MSVPIVCSAVLIPLLSVNVVLFLALSYLYAFVAIIFLLASHSCFLSQKFSC